MLQPAPLREKKHKRQRNKKKQEIQNTHSIPFFDPTRYCWAVKAIIIIIIIRVGRCCFLPLFKVPLDFYFENTNDDNHSTA
jgi:hypothetical protein